MSSYHDGWKQIATAVGLSVRTCHKLARRADDRLPVFKVGGTVRLNAPDLATWLERQATRRYGCESGCDDAGAP